MNGTLKSFQVNDQVVFLSEVGGGIITKIEGNFFYVLDETGFERPFLADQLSPVIQSMNKIELNEIQKENRGKSPVKSVKSQDSIPEIDLHIEQLVENHRGWTNHEILTFQIRTFRTFLEQSANQKAKRIVVIHGVGNGRLKQEIRSFLNGSKRYQFCDADFSHYGFGGATQVDIRLNWKD
jgi:dsDNA-specific endonuclease/ATPase MutS2